MWRARARAVWLNLRCRDAWRLPWRSARGLLGALATTRPATAPSGTIVYANCPPLEGAPYRRYLRGLARVARGERVPLVAHVAVTDRCGYSCARCSNAWPRAEDPPVAKLAALIGSLLDAGTASVALSGGEPNLRADLPEIVGACGGEISPILFTSGQGLDRARAEELRRAGLDAAFVSLDHFAADAHDATRGEKGAFDGAVAAIEACLGAGLYTAAQAVADERLAGAQTMREFLAFAKQLGVHDVVLLEPMPSWRATAQAPMGAARKARLAALHARAARDASLPKITAMPFFEGPAFFGCQAAFTFLYVRTDGEVFPCDFAPYSFGNAYALGLGEILARMARLVPGPSRECLAHALGGRRSPDERVPVPWERVAELMRGYDPGPPPELMRGFLPRERHR
jgi:MoaA/NifB/PqqE/SkfB family radical SAM enzyme